MAAAGDGQWSGVFDWPLIGLHAIVDDAGRVLTFGTDANGMQSGEFIYDVWDPATDTHYTLENTTPTDIFCSAAILIPGTGQILIGGGDARPLGEVNAGVADVNIYDSTDMSLAADPLGDMAYQRWYPTMVSLHSGQVVILGGTDIDRQGVGAVEIYTPGEGWRTLTGAYNAEVAQNPLYPRAWVSGSGEVIYIAADPGGDGENEVYALDPSGDGSLRQIGALPFTTSWSLPAANYAAGKALIMGHDGKFWSMDYSGATPTFTQVASLPDDRYWADMTVMADGRVLLNGGTTRNATVPPLNTADKTAAIWDPVADTWTETVDEGLVRLYHSTSLLLADGSILSLGGGAPGPIQNLNGEIYRPDYLFDGASDPVVQPTIQAPDTDIVPGGTFEITTADASDIVRVTLAKTGATTHSFNMDQYFVELNFVQTAPTTLSASLTGDAAMVTPGNWMVFAWTADGVPSQADIITIATSGEYHDGVGDWLAEYFVLGAGTQALADVDFTAAPDHVEDILALQIDAGTGAFWDGGPTDNFAMRTTGKLEISQPGEYTFFLTSDDGAVLYVDDVPVVVHDGLHAASERSATLALTEGWHAIEVRYFEAGGHAVLDLDWSGPAFSRKPMIFDGAAFADPGFDPTPDPDPDPDPDPGPEGPLLANGGLENADTGGLHIGAIEGWSSVAGSVEHWADGFSGVAAHEGAGFVELDNGGLVDTLYQDIDTEAGQDYALTFAARQRGGQSESVAVYWDGDLVATVTPDPGDAWTEFTLGVTGTGGLARLEFRELAGENNGLGPFLDAVALAAVDDPVVNPDPGPDPDPGPNPDPDPDPDPVGDILANGGLENPATGGMFVGSLDGWSSDAGSVEHWGDGFSGVSAFQGSGFVELDNGDLLDNLYQDVATDAGQHYELSFAARQRDGQGESVAVYWDGVLVTTVSPDPGADWTTYSLGVTGTGGPVRLEFRELAADNNGVGPFLDGIALTAVDDPVVNPDPEPEPEVPLLANAGLENASTGGMFVGTIDGWQSAAGSVEHWGDGFSGVSAHEGSGFVELDNGDLLDTLFQDVATEAGQDYLLTFAAGQRDGQTEGIEVYWGGSLIDTVVPDPGAEWTAYSFAVTGSGLDRLEFRERAEDNNGLGPFLDAIGLAPVP